MELLFIILIVLALWHFVYEGIILPSYRTELTYKIFGLRDQLRNLKNELGEDIKDEVFYYLDNSISASIRHIPQINLIVVFEINKIIKNNPEVKKEISDKIAIIESCKVSQIKDISDLSTKYSVKAMIANSGGWLLYIVCILLMLSPIIILVGVFIDLFHWCKKSIRRYIQGANFAPEEELSGIYSHESTTLTID